MKLGIWTVVILTIVGTLEAPAAFTPEFQKGMTFWSCDADEFGYSHEVTGESLEQLAATGTKWIALMFTWYQDGTSGTTISERDNSPGTAGITNVIQRAHALGMKVLMKPHVDPTGGGWRGDIKSSTETNWQAWFTSYKSFINHFADLAEAQGVDMLSVGCELMSTTSREADWRSVIAGVRSRYNGPLTYSSEGGDYGSYHFRNITWWDAVDYIGLDWYAGLTEKVDPTEQELTDAWIRHRDEIRAFYAIWQQPIIFTEVGYNDRNGMNQVPWDDTMSGTDTQEQSDCTRIMLETIWNEPWFYGMHWWSFAHDTADPFSWSSGNYSYNPYAFDGSRKPFLDVLEQYYAMPSPRGAAGSNSRPVVNAGTAATLQWPANSLAVSGSANDDGQPEGAELVPTWSQASGPAGVTFSDAAAWSTTAVFPGPGTYGLQLSASDSELSGSSVVTVTVYPEVVSIAIPGRLEAEAFNPGGEGVAYHDETTANEGGAYTSEAVDITVCTDTGGGYNVGYIADGEWLAYAVDVAQAGTYDLTARVAANGGSGLSFHVEIDGSDVSGPITFNGTGGWQVWADVTLTGISLPAGTHELRIVMEANEFNINYLDLVAADGPAPTVPDDPSALAATVQGPRTVLLNWADGSDDENGFRVEQQTSGGAFQVVADIAADTTAYQALDLTASTDYAFRVLAYNDAGASGYAGAVPARTLDDAAPNPPFGLMIISE